MAKALSPESYVQGLRAEGRPWIDSWGCQLLYCDLQNQELGKKNSSLSQEFFVKMKIQKAQHRNPGDLLQPSRNGRSKEDHQASTGPSVPSYRDNASCWGREQEGSSPRAISILVTASRHPMSTNTSKHP